MRSYRRIGVFENGRRIELLNNYRTDVVEYFNHAEFGRFGGHPTEDDSAKKARSRINLTTDEVCDVIHAAGLSTIMTYTPAPAIGGYVQDIELVHNLFHLGQFHVSPQALIDIVERAVGVYTRNHRAAQLRTINPFFYLTLGLDIIARSPFVLATRLGLPGRRFEDSLIGIVVRAAVYFGGAAASAIAVLGFLGYLDEARSLVERLFGI